MFSRDPVARRLRQLRRSLEAPLGLHEVIEPSDMLGALCRWGAAMPWVDESRGQDHAVTEFRFAIDCPELGCSEAWFAVALVDGGPGDGPEVRVVLPPWLAQRGVVLGWAAGVVDLPGGRTAANVAFPTTSTEFCALQRLLEVAYSSAFLRASEG
jgi:hypothetical protein